ncbi:MAG: hypothetical protein WDN46_24825 [Methylocella sp.]
MSNKIKIIRALERKVAGGLVRLSEEEVRRVLVDFHAAAGRDAAEKLSLSITTSPDISYQAAQDYREIYLNACAEATMKMYAENGLGIALFEVALDAIIAGFNSRIMELGAASFCGSLLNVGVA